MKNDTASWLVASTLALAVGALPACSGGGSSKGNTEPPDMVGMTAAHNAARAAVMPAASPALPNMTWSSAIATQTQSYTENCVFADWTGPNPQSDPWGSNAFAGTGTYTPADVVNAWVSEDAYYDYATNTCESGKVCGHYTQVVWRDSIQLGCGMTNCTKNNPFTADGSGNWVLWVCNYSPPGNYVGEKPY
jgi:pathogenesis-related protein 1